MSLLRPLCLVVVALLALHLSPSSGRVVSEDPEWLQRWEHSHSYHGPKEDNRGHNPAARQFWCANEDGAPEPCDSKRGPSRPRGNTAEEPCQDGSSRRGCERAGGEVQHRDSSAQASSVGGPGSRQQYLLEEDTRSEDSSPLCETDNCRSALAN